MNKMYELYVQFCSEKDVHRVYHLSSILIRCDFCEAHHVKAENGVLTEEDEESKLKNDSNKAAMRESRKVDREMRDRDTAVVSFDLQNVIKCPQAEISCFFYKRVN